VTQIRTEKKEKQKKTSDRRARWIRATGSDEERSLSVVSFDSGEQIRELSKNNDLMTTMAGLTAADIQSDGKIWHDVDCIKVFARMSPQGKAQVIRSLQKHRGLQVLMCGDGGNDVGALKQANVGLALLSGYGDANTGDEETKVDEKSSTAIAANDKAASAEDRLNKRATELKKKSLQNSARMKKELKAAITEIKAKQSQYMEQEKLKMQRAGVQQGFMFQISLASKVQKRLLLEQKQARIQIQKKYNVYKAKGNGKEDSPASIEDAMGDAGIPIVKPGDASVAAPFTSRIPSVRSVVDLIRQGRCTVLSTLQQQQIMMLECMIAAYTFSALTLEGSRSSERQMMASGWLIMIASLAFNYATPIDKMHRVRPLHSLFHPSIFLSIVGQVIIHLGCMIYGVRLATETMGPELMKEVVRFHKRQARADLLVEQDSLTTDADEDPWADVWSMWSKPFMPNLMNTTVFLVETSQLVAVLFVNYKGRPWMKGLTENHGLFLSVFICLFGVALCAWGVFPEINELMHLHPFPDDDFRWTVMSMCALSTVGTFLWDRLITAIFAPKVFGAMMESARETRVMDFWPVVKTMLYIVGGVYIFASGNLLLWAGAAYFWYSRRKAKEAEAFKV
jgi:cation-transporting ATPase 13A1